jgi:uncharacterized protein YutE (UPF0331/DUF86 family)
MKKLHKGVMAITAAITCVSMTVFTACDNGGSSDNNSDPSTPAGYIECVENAVQKQNIAGAVGTYSSDWLDAYDFPALKEYNAGQANITGQVAADFNAVQADAFMNMYAKYKFCNDDNYADRSTDFTDANIAEEYQAYFIRDGVYYNCASDKKIDTFDSTVTLYYRSLDIDKNNDTDYATLSYLVNGLEQLKGYEDVASELVNISLVATDYNALTIDSGKMTIDFAKLIKGLYDDVMATLESVSGTTTVLQLLQSSPVKNLLTALTKVVDTNAVYQSLKTSLGADEKVAAVAAALPAPTEGQSLYDYLITVVNNDGVGAAMGADHTLGSFTLNDIIAMAKAAGVEADINVDDLKTLVSSVLTITEEDGKVAVKMVADKSTQMVTFSSANLTYNIGAGYKLEGFSADFAFTTELEYMVDISSYFLSSTMPKEMLYPVTETSDVTFSCDFTVYSKDTLPALTDISECHLIERVNNSEDDY